MQEFPIMVSGLKLPCPSRIPWDAISPFEGQAIHNHGQTLQRLAERGGLCPIEAHFVMTNRDWKGIYNSNPQMEKEAVAFIEKVVRDRTEIVAERDALKLQVDELKKSQHKEFRSGVEMNSLAVLATEERDRMRADLQAANLQIETLKKEKADEVLRSRYWEERWFSQGAELGTANRLNGAFRAGLEWIKVNSEDEASRIMADDVLKAQEKRIEPQQNPTVQVHANDCPCVLGGECERK